MTIEEQLTMLEQNVKALLQRCATLQNEIDTLRDANKQQREELMKSHSEFVELEKQFKLLQTAHLLSTPAEGKEKAKREITKLIRLVDEALENLAE